MKDSTNMRKSGKSTPQGQQDGVLLSTGRRHLLKAALLTLGIGGAGHFLLRPRLLNPCRSPVLDALKESPWLTRVWDGLDPAQVWDCHVHLAGIGDSGNGLAIAPQMTSLWHPVLYVQRLFYLNAGCVSNEPGSVDENYARRLALIAQNVAPGFKALLFAFDWYHDETGRPDAKRSTFHVPDDYAFRLAAARPDVFEWAASIHPYASDAVDRLESAAARGARAVKWLPAAQNIDPASPRCAPFFAALARLNLPLISHCGLEKAAQNASLEHFGNPLRLRRALEAGVRVVAAHCASLGTDEDLDSPGTRLKSFDLFLRLMEQPEWKGRLFGDISAIVLRNRKLETLRVLLERDDLHDRLLNGSDYPLPGIVPVVSPSALARHGFLPKEAVSDLETLREHNPLFFDLALKRALSWKGKSFPARIFATRAFFGPVADGPEKSPHSFQEDRHE